MPLFPGAHPRHYRASLGGLLLITLLTIPPSARAETDRADTWIAFNRAGAGNSQLQCFTPDNVRVLNGNLVIITNAQRATCSSIDLPPMPRAYSSGFVSMRAFAFLYGTLEFRAKFGGGARTGSWPAVWMADASCQVSDPTGTDDRCNEQEIDVAEILNGDFARVNQQIHVDHFAHNDGCTALTSDTSQNFHVYQLVWSPRLLVFKIDGATTCTISQSYVPRSAMYVKISANVGSFGGPVRNDTLPWTTLVDYVKVTQGSSVVFNDDFTSSSSIRRAPAAATAPASHDRSSSRTSMWSSGWRWPAGLVVIGLVIAITKLRKRYRLQHAALG